MKSLIIHGAIKAENSPIPRIDENRVWCNNMVSIESISGIPILRIVSEKFMRRIDAA